MCLSVPNLKTAKHNTRINFNPSVTTYKSTTIIVMFQKNICATLKFKEIVF